MLDLSKGPTEGPTQRIRTPGSTARAAGAVDSGDPFPRAGEALGDLVLLAELGRGATSRVFLARQSLLGDRPLVLTQPRVVKERG
jgi:hypothetical protein